MTTRWERPLTLAIGALMMAVSPSASAQDPSPPSIEELQTRLITGDVSTRLVAVGSLSRDASEEATETLVFATTDVSSDVRRLAYSALGSRHVANDALEPVLGDAEVLVRITGAHAIGARQSPERLELLERILDQESESRVRATAAAVIATRWQRGGAFPTCAEMEPRWRRAHALGIDGAREAEAIATIMESVALSANACGLNAEEWQEVVAQSARFGQDQRAPEITAVATSALKLVVDYRARMRVIEEAVDPDLETRCLAPLRMNYGEFHGLVLEVERQADAIRQNPQNTHQIHNLRAIVSTLESYVVQTENCVANPDAFDPYGGAHHTPHRANQTWIQAGLEILYDDHFLSRRNDVANLRETDQLAQRVVGRIAWNSEPIDFGARVPLRKDEPFYRIRAELAEDIYNGESQLSGPSAWADFYFQELVDHDLAAWAVAEGGYERGWRDRSWPQRLIQPHGWGRALAGVSILDERDDNNPWFAMALGVEGVGYNGPDNVPALRALAADSQPTGALDFYTPPDADDGSKVTTELITRIAPLYEDESSLFIELANRTHIYPQGLPVYRLVETADPFVREAPLYTLRDEVAATQTRVELGAHYVDYDAFVIALLGATISWYPEAEVERLASFTGRFYGEVTEDFRDDDGFKFFADLWHRVDDSAGVGDAQSHIGGRVGVGVWEDDGDGAVELDVNMLVDFVSRDMALGDSGRDISGLLDEDEDLESSSVRVAGAMAFIIEFEEAPTVLIEYQIEFGSDRSRSPHFKLADQASELGELRNVVMLSLYGTFGGANIEFHDDRSPSWGIPHMRDVALPPLWWYQP